MGLRAKEDEEKASWRQTNDVISVVRVWPLGQVGHSTNSCQGRDRQSDEALVERCGLEQSDEVFCGRQWAAWRSWGLVGPYRVPGPGLGAVRLSRSAHPHLGIIIIPCNR